MRRLIKNRIISRLWLARIVSVFGDIFFDIFVTWSLYSRFKDLKVIVYALGGSFVLKSLFAVFAGKISDTFSRRKIIIATDLLSAAVAAAFLFFDAAGNGAIPLFVALFIVKTFLGVLFSNAFSSFFADNVPKADFIKAQALISGSVRTINFFGAALAGVLVAVLPLRLAVSLDALTFLFSAAVFYSLRSYMPAEAKGAPRPEAEPSARLSAGLLRDSWAFVDKNILSDRFVLAFCGNVFFLNLVYGYVPNVFPYMLSGNSGYGAAYLGVLRSTIAVGEVLGLGVVGKYGHRVSRCFILGLAGTVISLLLILIPLAPVVTVLVAYFAYGFSDSLTQPYYSHFVSSLPSQIRGRMLGVVDMVVLIAAPIGMVIGEKLCAVSVGTGVVVFALIVASVLTVFVAGKRNRGITAEAG
ncbi:MAG: MFS transporter [Elusimicrobiales bacterium]|nr:MFS transporter [Elusimicrobiales bacterium]